VIYEKKMPTSDKSRQWFISLKAQELKAQQKLDYALGNEAMLAKPHTLAPR